MYKIHNVALEKTIYTCKEDTYKKEKMTSSNNIALQFSISFLHVLPSSLFPFSFDFLLTNATTSASGKLMILNYS